MSTAAAREASEPIIIYRSVNRDGQTFTLDPLSMDRLREYFDDAVHVRSRVFVAHESIGSYESLGASLAAQIVTLLTGVPQARLEPLGGVSFRDPHDDEELALAGSSDATRSVSELG